jgi:hypothetical protein
VSADSHKSQRSALLALLLRAKGAEVSLLEILRLNIAQYSARIHELRKLGFRIVNRTECRDGKRCSWFRLEPGPLPSKPQTPAETQPKLQQETLALSGEERLRYPD